MSELDFHPTASSFDKTNALALARAAQLVYADNAEVASTLESWGFSRHQFFDHESIQAFLGASDTAILLSFRGTQEPEDIAVDAKLRLVDGPRGRVHRGINESLGEVWAEIREGIEQLRGETSIPLWVTGHSLGAALASLATGRLILQEEQPVQGLYNFGSPRMGDTVFAAAFDEKLRERTFRLVNNNDVVPRVPIPGRLLPYRHVGTLVYIDATGRLRPTISWWQKMLDRLRGRVNDLGRPGTDGMNDHRMARYVEHLEKAA